VTDFETLAAGLRAWAQGDRIAEAAVGLLIEHETWLRRGDFPAACIDSGDGMSRPDWDDAKAFIDAGVACSTTELAVLKLAVAIGSDEYRLAAMGRANARAITAAFALALGGAR
jgi:hypothetical protein